MARWTQLGGAAIGSGRPIEYRAIGSIRGPLIVVQDVERRGLGRGRARSRSSRARSGTAPCSTSHRDLAVVEILEGTSGMRLDSARVAFSGAPMQIPVGEGWLGRTCNGRGEPIDGGPPVLGGEQRPVAGAPINPAARAAPTEAILTGVSAIDGLATLVRGQKLPVFSVGGLPHLELAAQVAAQAHVEGEPFAIVFAALGLPHADVHAVRSVLERRAELGDLALFVNTADDPVVERIVTPRVALTVAEHLAFDLGRHVLVVLADLTNYCEAVRQVSAARGEVPSRRGYPGYLYSDLASLLERAGRIKGVAGSLTQLPVLTMPAGDITHPVPDVTGYITEGQLVLSPELYARGISPPFDPLASLSRLMRHGAGPGLTRDDHLEISAQTVRDRRPRAPGRRPRGGGGRGRAVARATATTSVPARRSSRTSSPSRSTRSARSRRRSIGPGPWRRSLPRGELSMISPPRSTPTTARRAMALRIPPGRAGRIWLVGRLEIAQARRRAARPQAPGAAARAGAGPRRGCGRRAARGRTPPHKPPCGAPAPRWSTVPGGWSCWLATSSGQASLELSWSNLMGAQPPSVERDQPFPTRRRCRRSAPAPPRDRCARLPRGDACGGALRGRRARRRRALRRARPRGPAAARAAAAVDPEHEQALAQLDLALDESQREQAARVRWLTPPRPAVSP